MHGPVHHPTRQCAARTWTRRLATEALRIDPQNAVATELRGQATTGLNAMDAITDLGAMNTLTTLSKQVTGEVQISGTIVQGGTVYLLDVKGGRVLSLAVGGPPDPKTLFKEGEAYRGTPAKRPIYFTWDATAGRILVLDAERKLFSVGRVRRRTRSRCAAPGSGSL